MSILRFLRAFGAQDLFVIACIYSLCLVQMPNFANDPGVGWHLKTGELIYASGVVPKSDPFLAFEGARPWICNQWLSDLIFYLIYSVNTWPLLYAVLTVLYLLSYFAILYRGVFHACGSSLAAAFAVILAFKLGQVHFILRPTMIGFLLFTVLYLKLYRMYYRMQEANNTAHPTLRDYLLYMFLFLLWANLHPSFVLGLLLLAILPIALIANNLFLSATNAFYAGKRQIGALVLLFILCCAVTLINPNFIDLHHGIFSLGQSDFFMNLHQEWLSPNFKEREGLFLEISLFVLFAAIFLVGRARLGWQFFEFITVILFAHLSLSAVRMLPYYGIVAAIPFAQALVAGGELKIFKISAFWGRMARLMHKFDRYEGASLKGTVSLFAAVMLILCSALVQEDRVFLYQGTPGPSPKNYPYQAIDFLLEAEQQNSPVVVASIPYWGGFISFKGYPVLKPLMDDRNELLGEAAYRDYQESYKIEAEWRGYLKKHKAAYLLLPTGHRFAQGLVATKALEILYQDNLAILYKVPT